jgi:hypothetical protein
VFFYELPDFEDTRIYQIRNFIKYIYFDFPEKLILNPELIFKLSISV